VKTLNDEQVFCAFSKDLEPVLSIASGETVRIRTKDCFANQVRRPEDKLDEIDWDTINPATGPIFIEGTKAGGVLKVEILSIEIDEQTASCTGEGEGVCGNLFKGWSTHLCAISNGELVWNDALSIPLKPMIGVIGVAPSGESVNCGTPGSHGGNMDNTEIKEGATLYLPVAVDGALFGCGDLHAAMGDGEVSVSAAEIAGTVTLRLTALPDKVIHNPIVENSTHFGTIASAETLDEAARTAVHDMVRLVHEASGVPEDELVMLFSLTADVRVCQMVDPDKTARFMVPLYVLDALGFSF
jgi:amidase